MTKTGKFVLFIVLATLLVLLAKMQNEAKAKSMENSRDSALHSSR